MGAVGIVDAKARTERGFEWHRNASFVSLLVGYAGYYLCRANLATAIPDMSRSLRVSEEDLGIVVSVGTAAYALGKVTTGSLADAKGGRFVFFVGLIGSVIASLIFPLGTGIVSFSALWALNLFCQSMGWGGLVNVVSRWFPRRQYGTAMGVMSFSYQFGAVLAALFSGWLLVRFDHDWRWLFLTPSLVLAALGVGAHFFLVDSPAVLGFPLPSDAEEPSALAGSSPASRGEGEGDTYFSRLASVLSDRMFLVTCGLSFVLTLLRTCFNNWTPSYFTHVGASSSTAAFKSAVFPLLGCAGTFVAGWYSDRFLEGRRGPIMAVFLAVTSALLASLAGLEPIAAWSGIDRGTVALALIGATGFFLLGSYSLVGGVSALDFGGRRTAGTAAGILDGVGYVGGTLAGWGAARLFTQLGWPTLYLLMAALVFVGIGLCKFTWNVKPR